MDAEWEEALAHITANPELASKKKNDGSYLIHAVLLQSYPPPVELVAALLRANPNAAALPHKGLLPLHLALDSVAAPEVVRALLEAHPHGAQQEITHQPRLKGCLSEVSGATGISTSACGCPLGGLAQGASPRLSQIQDFDRVEVLSSKVEILLTAYPQAALEKDKHGMLPLHCAAQLHVM
eukprot:jgi/Tetstr1/462794/TSEL_007744.t1